MTELFEEVLRLTDVSRDLGLGMLRRALTDGRIAIETAGPEDYEAALPRIRARLKAYLTPEEAEARCAVIAAYLAQLKTTRRSTPAAAPARERLDRGRSGEHDIAHAATSQAPPREGTKAEPAANDLGPDEVTQLGRRWTKDEQAQIDALKRKPV